MMYPFNHPLSVPACCWVPFQLFKHPLSYILSQRQWNSQVELSKATRDDFKISKRKRTRRHSAYIPIYQSSLQCDVCIPSYMVTRPVTKGSSSLLGKIFPPSEKCHGHIVCITIVCAHAIDVKFGPPLEHSSPSGVQSWLRVCLWLLPGDFCQLCHSAQPFHNHILQV